MGGAQRLCPAWLIYAWCEQGDSVAWDKKDLANIHVERQYEKEHLKWWFTSQYNGGCGVGSKWSCSRHVWDDSGGDGEVFVFGATEFEDGPMSRLSSTIFMFLSL